MRVSRDSTPRLLNGYTLLLACLAVYLPCLWQLPLIRAEAMYALIPKEMLASGFWLTPSLNGVHYLDKPHLLYWLNLLGYKILGVSDWAARVPTLAVTLAQVWLTYLIGRRLLGRTAAWLGAFALLSCIGFFSLYLQILTDHLITLTLTGSLYALWRWQEEPDFRWGALFYLCLVAGFLSKGFIGMVFPVAIGLIYAWHLKQSRIISLLVYLPGLALVALLLVPWSVGSELANPGFLKFQIINEQILRFLGQRQPPDINPFALPGFWLFLGIWLMPWTFLLPEGLYRFWRATRPGGEENRPGRLLIIWALVILIFFSISSSRIEYYSLPAFPALALIVGWRLQRYLDTPADRVLFWVFLGIGLLGLGTLFLLPYLERICVDNRREFIGMFALLYPIARPVTFLIPALALAGALAAIFRRRAAAVAGYGALALVLIFLTFKTLLALSPQLSDQLPGNYLKRVAAPQDLVIMGQIEEFEYGASLAFYSNHPILIVKRGSLPQFPYPVAPEADYLISPERLQELWLGPRKVFLLLDDDTPVEPFLKGATVAMRFQGKRLLVNRP